MKEWKPRPDQPERLDQQTAFYESRLPGVAVLIGGYGSGKATVAMRKAVEFILRGPMPINSPLVFRFVLPGNNAPHERRMVEFLLRSCTHAITHGAGEGVVRLFGYRPDGLPYRVLIGPANINTVRGIELDGFAILGAVDRDFMDAMLSMSRQPKPGAMSIAFYPEVPEITSHITDRIDDGTLPDGWGVFRTNTECAVESGHVSREWYDAFIGAENQRRKTGDWSNGDDDR